MNQQPYQFRSYGHEEAANSSLIVQGISNVFSNSFGVNPRTGKPYRLGPQKTKERLLTTNYVFIADHVDDGIIGYLYARAISSTNGAVAWIDSIAVLPNHRRKRVATSLAHHLLAKAHDSRWIGCATPNPIAALVITRTVGGVAYVGECDPPAEVISMIQQIRPHCPDLSGADFNPRRLLVKTQFTPTSSEDTTEWKPPHPSEPPPWWASLEHLPEEYEALLVIDRNPGQH